MERYYRYYFMLTSDSGRFLINVVSYSKKRAVKMILEAEGCPRSAIEFSSKDSVNL